MRTFKLLIAAAALSTFMFALLSNSTLASSRGLGASADGAALFSGKCALCHGKDGAGLPNWKSKGQPDLTSSDWQKSHTDAQIAGTIKDGKGKYMPPFKAKLSDEEVGAIVARVRALGRKK